MVWLGSAWSPGGYSNYFLTGCAAQGLKPLPISKDFSPSKNGWFKAFFRNFRNWDPFLRVFLPQNGWFYIFFFVIFAKWDPLLRIFLSKMGPMSKDSCWKSNPFGRHIPVCLNMWVPPRGMETYSVSQIGCWYKTFQLKSWDQDTHKCSEASFSFSKWSNSTIFRDCIFHSSLGFYTTFLRNTMSETAEISKVGLPLPYWQINFFFFVKFFRAV